MPQPAKRCHYQAGGHHHHNKRHKVEMSGSMATTKTRPSPTDESDKPITSAQNSSDMDITAEDIIITTDAGAPDMDDFIKEVDEEFILAHLSADELHAAWHAVPVTPLTNENNRLMTTPVTPSVLRGMLSFFLKLNL